MRIPAEAVVAWWPTESVTWKLAVYDPAVCGVPEIVPFELSDKPGAGEPLATVQE